MDIAINSFLDDVPNMDNQWNWWKHRYLLILKGLEFGTTRHLRCKYLMVTHGILAHQYTPQVRGGLSGTHMTCHLLAQPLYPLADKSCVLWPHTLVFTLPCSALPRTKLITGVQLVFSSCTYLALQPLAS